jgi:hypothetical protein
MSDKLSAAPGSRSSIQVHNFARYCSGDVGVFVFFDYDFSLMFANSTTTAAAR